MQSSHRKRPRRLSATFDPAPDGAGGNAGAVGAGELAPDARVLLLDEYRVGYGASGRNSGFIIDTPHLSEHLSDEDNRRVSRLIVAGLADLKNHVREHGIDCEWSPRGHLTAVVGSRRESKLQATARMLDAAGEDYERYDRAAVAQVTGADHYHGAVLTPRTVLVNPAALCRRLGDTLPGNVELCEHVRVLRVEPGSPVRVECAEASIRARNVLLTTNAFIARLGFLRRAVFPLIACASLSRPLTGDEQAAMGGESDWGITGVTTMRRTRSNRILVRHGLGYTWDFRFRFAHETVDARNLRRSCCAPNARSRSRGDAAAPSSSARAGGSPRPSVSPPSHCY